MNERIKLPAQEWLGYDPERGDLHGYTFEQMREFAELIVKQCANIVRNSSLPDSYSEACLEYIADELEEHFGVEP
jgi:hypothetical protein